MNPTRPIVRVLATMAWLACALVAAGCSLEAASVSCADCGQVRAITPRHASREIRLLTDAPQATRVAASEDQLVWDVRVRMDRGGSRDFTIARREALRVGDRVEIRDGRPIPVARLVGLGLT